MKLTKILIASAIALTSFAATAANNSDKAKMDKFYRRLDGKNDSPRKTWSVEPSGDRRNRYRTSQE